MVVWKATYLLALCHTSLTSHGILSLFLHPHCSWICFSISVDLHLALDFPWPYMETVTDVLVYLGDRGSRLKPQMSLTQARDWETQCW